MSDTQVKGLAELQRALDQLPAKVEAAIMRAAVRAGAKVVAQAARANVHSVSGQLAASVRFGASPDKKAGKVVGYVRAGGRAGKKHPGAFYAHMVEHGTAAHVIRVRPPGKALALGVAEVQHPGARKAPFLRPAMDQQAFAALEAMREYIRKRLATKHGLDVPAPVDPAADE